MSTSEATTTDSAGTRTQRVPHFAGGRRITWRDRPIPVPGTGDLLVRVRANALCGTDRHQLTHGAEVTPGHEAAGEVVAAGSATSIPVGTLGAIYLMLFCAACRSCAVGATNQCLAKSGDLGFTRDGGLSQFECVPERCFFPVGDDLSPAEATLLLDVMGTSSHAIGRAVAIRADAASIAIAGAGPAGLGTVAMARLRLGDGFPIFAMDMIPYRLDLARRLGAISVDVRTSSLADALREAGITHGVDVAIDTSGRASARRPLLEALGRRGVLVCVGHGEGLALDVSADLIASERSVLGSEYFPIGLFEGNLELLRRHRPYLGQIVTHQVPVANVEEAYRLFLGGESGKVVVVQ